jgi:hypothetical protein
MQSLDEGEWESKGSSEEELKLLQLMVRRLATSPIWTMYWCELISYDCAIVCGCRVPLDVESSARPLALIRLLGELLMIYAWNFHVLSHLLLIYICKLHWKPLASIRLLGTGWFCQYLRSLIQTAINCHYNLHDAVIVSTWYPNPLPTHHYNLHNAFIVITSIVMSSFPTVWLSTTITTTSFGNESIAEIQLPTSG